MTDWNAWYDDIWRGFVGAIRLFLGLFYRPRAAIKEFLNG